MQNITDIDINEIRPNPYQPRRNFDKDALNDLAESIKEHGVFTPILVRKTIKGYDLIAGERRLKASKIAKQDTIPAIIVDYTDEQMMEVAIIENLQREDLSCIEEAQAYESLIKRLGYTQEELAKKIGKSREYCANMIRLLKLPLEVQKMVETGKLTVSHVRPLLALPDDEIFDAALYVYFKKMSSKDVEEYVRKILGKEKVARSRKEMPAEFKSVETHMKEKLGTNVDITSKKISISYTDVDDFNRILEIIGCLDESISE